MDELAEGIQLALLSEELGMANPDTRRKFDRLLARLAHLNMSVLHQRKMLHCILCEQAEEERMDQILKATAENDRPVYPTRFPAPHEDE